MTRAVFWVPGLFSLTNNMLSNLRAAGRYQGRRPRKWRDVFEEETRAIRLATRAAAKDNPTVQGLVDVFVWVLGHHRHDPDAWLLLGKAAVDGLVDARVIASDRIDLHCLGGRVTATHAEDSRARTRFAPFVGATIGTGFFIELMDARGCGHA